MPADKAGGRFVRQRATATGSGQIIQVAGDLYNYVASESGPTPHTVNTLPAEPGPLMGREEHIDQLMQLLNPAGRTPQMVVPTVAGLAGVGKTALILHAAHRAVELGWFPGGALFLDLQGYDPDGHLTAEQAAEALTRVLLGSLGGSSASPNDNIAILRSTLSSLAKQGLPVLLVADNASSGDQVTPLIPSARQHRLMVTSRETLSKLPHARLIDLDELDSAAAVELITAALRRARPGDPRPAAESAAIVRLAKLCAGLPLALEIIAQLLIAIPGLRAADLADELADERTRLSARSGETGGGRLFAVRAAFDLSNRRLDDATGRLFRLLALNPGPDIASKAAARLIDRPLRQSTELLYALAQAHLIKEQPVGAGRWRMHDLIHLYAADLAAHDPEPEEREAAVDRLVEHYRSTAQNADATLRFRPGQFPSEISYADAQLWFGRERQNLRDAVTLASTSGREQAAISIALSSAYYLCWLHHFDDTLATACTAIDTATRIGARHDVGAATNNLGIAFKDMRRFDEAIATFQKARGIYQELGDRHNEAKVVNNLANALREQQVYLYGEAINTRQQADTASRKVGGRRRKAKALADLDALRKARELLYADAIKAHRHAAATLLDLGDQHGQAAALAGLSLDLLKAGRFEAGVAAGIESSKIFAELGDEQSAASVEEDLKYDLVRAGRFEDTIAVLTRIAQCYAKVGDRFGQIATRAQLAAIEREARGARSIIQRLGSIGRQRLSTRTD